MLHDHDPPRYRPSSNQDPSPMPRSPPRHANAGPQPADNTSPYHSEVPIPCQPGRPRHDPARHGGVMSADQSQRRGPDILRGRSARTRRDLTPRDVTQARPALPSGVLPPPAARLRSPLCGSDRRMGGARPAGGGGGGHGFGRPAALLRLLSPGRAPGGCGFGLLAAPPLLPRPGHDPSGCGFGRAHQVG